MKSNRTQLPRPSNDDDVPRISVSLERIGAIIKLLQLRVMLQDGDINLIIVCLQNYLYVAERVNRFDINMAGVRRIFGIFRNGIFGGRRKPKNNQADVTDGHAAVSALPDALAQAPCAADDNADDDTVAGGDADDSTNLNGSVAAADERSPSSSIVDGANADAADCEDALPNRDDHGRRSLKDFGNLPTQHHTHSDLGVGCSCPSCHAGRLYRFFPRTFVSIVGQAPFAGCRHEIDRLQCNRCKKIFEAELPEALQNDGVGNGNLYAFSAASMVVALKYLGVMPWHRQETLQAAIGVEVPDASMFDMCERLVDIARPVTRVLEENAAQAPLFYGDDTSAMILGLDAETKIDRRSGKPVERTGCHTTCVIARLPEHRHIAIFRVGIQHTGELLDIIMRGRDDNLPAPYVMADASTCNSVTVRNVIMCACNAHALRHFKALEKEYPKDAGYILERYRAIYKTDAHTTQEAMSSDERLAYHRVHSRPLFKEMCVYANTLLENHILEPNSNIGQACDYLLNHQRALSAFYRYPGVPIDNNFTERELRLPVRLRDAAPFFKNKVGAAVAAQLWTLCVTALLANVPLFDYLNAMQRFSDDVRDNPKKWLPWNYRDRVTLLCKRARASQPAKSPVLCLETPMPSPTLPS